MLSALRLVDGIAVHEHYGFQAEKTPDIFPAPEFRLARWQRFQFGLNNLFVEKGSGPAEVLDNSTRHSEHGGRQVSDERLGDGEADEVDHQ